MSRVSAPEGILGGERSIAAYLEFLGLEDLAELDPVEDEQLVLDLEDDVGVAA